MPIYFYKAKDSQNNNVKGTIEASSAEQAGEILQEKGWRPVSLKQREGRIWEKQLAFLNRISSKERVIFSRQLAVMISANVPIVRVLRILVKQTSNLSFKIIISHLADEVEGGAKLSSAMARYPRVFSAFYVNIIRSGETSGKLDEVLNYLADQEEKDYDLMVKIRGAMMYPALILAGLVGVGVVMMIMVIPKLTDILESSGAELPLSTKILIATSSFFVNWWWLALIFLLTLLVALRVAVNFAPGRYALDLLKIRLPIFGKLFTKIYLIRFGRSLNTLIKGGVTISNGLQVVANVINNSVYHELIMQTINEVENGNSISTVFSKSKHVPIMVSQLMVIGEQTGRLDDVLEKLTQFYTRDVDNMVNNLVTLIEPLIMILMGVAVGFMVAAVLLPMYRLAESI